MLQTEFLDALTDAAIGTKEKITQKGRKDLSPFVMASRGDEPVALVTVRVHDPDVILQVAGAVAGGFDADRIGIVFESYQEAAPDHPDLVGINPQTGNPWREGEMAALAENYDGIGAPLATECVSIVCGNRAGDVAFTNLPFRYVHGRHLHWIQGRGQWSTTDPGREVGGRFPSALRRMMIGPSASQALPNLPGDRTDRDLVTAQFLLSEGHAPLLYAESTDLRRIAKLQRFGPPMY